MRLAYAALLTASRRAVTFMIKQVGEIRAASFRAQRTGVCMWKQRNESPKDCSMLCRKPKRAAELACPGARAACGEVPRGSVES